MSICAYASRVLTPWHGIIRSKFHPFTVLASRCIALLLVREFKEHNKRAHSLSTARLAVNFWWAQEKGPKPEKPRTAFGKDDFAYCHGISNCIPIYFSVYLFIGGKVHQQVRFDERLGVLVQKRHVLVPEPRKVTGKGVGQNSLYRVTGP